jgi:hypothetical protein
MTNRLRRLWRHILRRFRPSDAFLCGMGSVLDIGGTLGPTLPYGRSMTAEEAAQADRQALWEDWLAVDRDFQAAIEEFEEGLW